MQTNQTQATGQAVCPECRYEDGSLNVEKLNDEGACTYGCGRKIDEYKWCRSCRDHSANQYECQTCGNVYGDWEGSWKTVSEAHR